MAGILAGATFDLILLDVMLSGRSGLDLCRTIRLTSRVPIIMVSARGDEIDRVLGLEIAPTITWRSRSVPRNCWHVSEPLLRLDRRRRDLVDPDGVAVELSGAEHDLLVTFLENPQRVIGRERLLELSRNRLADTSDRSIAASGASSAGRMAISSAPSGALTLHGWFFDLASGTLYAMDSDTKTFSPVEDDEDLPVALPGTRRAVTQAKPILAAA